ncbi:hypothetical protein EVAR_103881_1 [Eumeta japonica]|uniref:Uncharacterized protein n=1 Tax=Eumeta variegata TaxID=151549 RepID=A0A4C1ZJH5_EUMVA|nr:hypothetical protein EVAR_103881_1 [Eumeta japonica]
MHHHRCATQGRSGVGVGGIRGHDPFPLEMDFCLIVVIEVRPVPTGPRDPSLHKLDPLSALFFVKDLSIIPFWCFKAGLFCTELVVSTCGIIYPFARPQFFFQCYNLDVTALLYAVSV